jgi:hypothetical protein
MKQLQAVAVILLCLSCEMGHSQPASLPDVGSKIWIGRYHEMEEYLRTADCDRIEVFKPSYAARCTFKPGGPIHSMAWRSPSPGPNRGFHESYKTEIAAYEVDRLLKMDMVPPTVERRLQGNDGAAQLWVENIVDGKAGVSPDQAHRTAWENQIVVMTMFDNLIGNRDRNVGNMLRDPAWNLILIDHSRAFGTDTGLGQKMNRADKAFWAKIESLTRKQLDTALGTSLDEGQITAILERRDRMRAEIGSLPK